MRCHLIGRQRLKVAKGISLKTDRPLIYISLGTIVNNAVPQQAVLKMADQPTNARRVCELGLGMKELMWKCPGNKGGVEEILNFYSRGEK